MLFNDTKYYQESSKTLKNFIIDYGVGDYAVKLRQRKVFLNELTEHARHLAKVMSSFGLDINEDGTIIKKFNDFFSMPPPIGCRTLHFPKTIGKHKYCMYCNKRVN